jgi:hypothetical protein
MPFRDKVKWAGRNLCPKIEEEGQGILKTVSKPIQLVYSQSSFLNNASACFARLGKHHRLVLVFCLPD